MNHIGYYLQRVQLHTQQSERNFFDFDSFYFQTQLGLQSALRGIKECAYGLLHIHYAVVQAVRANRPLQLVEAKYYCTLLLSHLATHSDDSLWDHEFKSSCLAMLSIMDTHALHGKIQEAMTEFCFGLYRYHNNNYDEAFMKFGNAVAILRQLKAQDHALPIDAVWLSYLAVVEIKLGHVDLGRTHLDEVMNAMEDNDAEVPLGLRLPHLQLLANVSLGYTLVDGECSAAAEEFRMRKEIFVEDRAVQLA